jgi:hypothetical protein
LIADVFRQIYPDHIWFDEPGLVKGQNTRHLAYKEAIIKSRTEIENLKFALARAQNILFKTVAGATYFDLGYKDLECFGMSCRIIWTSRDPVDGCISYLAGKKSRRFFNKDGTKFEGQLTYVPDEDDGQLFWCVYYYVQAQKWLQVLENIKGARIEYVSYEELRTYDDVKARFEITQNIEHRIRPPHEMPYSELFTNYKELRAACSRLCRALDLL